VIYFASFAGPVMTIPQIYDVWTSKSPSVSELTWASYIIIAVIWLYYGIVHKEKPIILSNVLWIVAEAAVLIGLHK